MGKAAQVDDLLAVAVGSLAYLGDDDDSGRQTLRLTTKQRAVGSLERDIFQGHCHRLYTLYVLAGRWLVQKHQRSVPN